MKEKVKVAYVGIGRRGGSVLRDCFAQMNDVEISVICDTSEKMLERGKQILLDKEIKYYI